MRRSSQVGFAASIGLAILSASLVADFSSEREAPYFLSKATAGMVTATGFLPDLTAASGRTGSSVLPAEMRRRALVNRVHQKLTRSADEVAPILF